MRMIFPEPCFINFPALSKVEQLKHRRYDNEFRYRKLLAGHSTQLYSMQKAISFGWSEIRAWSIGTPTFWWFVRIVSVVPNKAKLRTVFLLAGST